MEIDILGIERAVIGVLRPGVGVTGGDADHGVGLGQLVHNALVQITGGEARVAGAKRQVHHIAVQQNGVLDGGHVVGVVRAAGLAEDLHDDELGVGRGANHKGGFHGGHIALTLRHIPVGGGDARHMGAVTALAVVVMGHVQIPVNVVVGEGNFVGQMQDIRRQGIVLLEDAVPIVVALVNVKLGQNGSDLLFIQQAQGVHVRLRGHAGGLGVVGHGVQVSAIVHSLMVCIQAGVNDGHPGTGAGVAGGPDGAGPSHGGGGAVVRLSGALFRLARLILGFQNHFGNAPGGFDLFDVPVAHVGGDDVARQSQVPGHVQLGADGRGNPVRHGLLVGNQALPVGLGALVGGQAHGGIALVQHRRLFQNNGHAHHVVLIRFLLGAFLCRTLLQRQVCRHAVWGSLLKSDGSLPAPAGIYSRRQAQKQAQHQQHR